MFKNLISNLPFSPSLIDQVALHVKQLKHQSRLRGVGLLLLSAALVLQLMGSFLIPVATQPIDTQTNSRVLGASVTAGSATQQPHSSNTLKTQPTGVLPQTTPKYGIIISFVFIMVVLFFYARDLLLAKELALVKAGFTSNSGF